MTDTAWVMADGKKIIGSAIPVRMPYCESAAFRERPEVTRQPGSRALSMLWRTFRRIRFSVSGRFKTALGYRAIRICLKQPEIFKAQLRALFRAAVYGNLSVMYPMITSTEEVEKIYAIVAEVEEELKKQEVQYKIPEQGIMIETPAAVMISDRLAEMVDFFSIGTNDLTQYTLAIDRQNEQLDDFYNAHHEAVLRMIRMVVENAHKCGKWAGICGELGADLTLTEQFVRMGVDELSVAPSMILKLRKIVREMKAEE